jgi:GNAT superfamily N-acetyltransferase
MAAVAAPTWTVHRWQHGDDLDALPALLYRAYAPLAAARLNFTAATQTDAATRQRMQAAYTWVALQGGVLVDTIPAAGPCDAHAQAWFCRSDVARFHRCAVDPALQGQGIGAALLQAAETWARSAGHRAMLLDTAAPATSLRQRDARAGHADIPKVQWQGKADRSAGMVEPLAPPLATDTDPAHHAATARALWAGFQARDRAAARSDLADDATLFWRASGGHLRTADASPA